VSERERERERARARVYVCVCTHNHVPQSRGPWTTVAVRCTRISRRFPCPNLVRAFQTPRCTLRLPVRARACVCVCVHACVCARARACSVVWCSRNNIEANKCTQNWTRMRRDGRRAAGTRHGQTWLKVGTSVTWQSSFRARQVGMCTVLAVCEGARGTARRAQKQHCLSGARPSRQACGRDRTRAHALCVQSHSASHRQTRASARTHCPSLLLTSIRSCLATMMRRQSSWT